MFKSDLKDFFGPTSYRAIGTRDRQALSLTAASSDWGGDRVEEEEEEEEKDEKEEKEEKEEEEEMEVENLRRQKNRGLVEGKEDKLRMSTK